MQRTTHNWDRRRQAKNQHETHQGECAGLRKGLMVHEHGRDRATARRGRHEIQNDGYEFKRPRARAGCLVLPHFVAFRSRCLRIGKSVMSAPPRPSPPVLMDHQPFVALPDADALDMRATDMANRGECAGALPLHQQVLVLAQRAHAAAPTPQTTLDVVFAMWQLGTTQRTLGDLPGAQAVLQQAVALAEPPPVGPDHLRLALALRDLGRVLYERGRYDEADATLQRALTMQEQLLGPEHEDVSLTLTQMGESCINQGNFRRAKGLLKRAVAIGELHAVPDEYPDQLCNALNSLCGVYNNLKDHELAQEKAERHLALDEQFQGPHHPDVAAALINVAVSLKGQGKLSDAQPMYERALAILVHVHGPHHPDVATCLSNLGALHLKQQDHRRAKAAFERALTIREHVLGPQHLQVATTFRFLGDSCCGAGDLAQAKTWYERALDIYQTQLGRTHPDTAAILQRLADLATIAGRPRQAAALSKRSAIAAVAATHQPCGWCGKMDVHASKKCDKCLAVWYCNQQCQLQAWPEHKKHCYKKPALPAPEPEEQGQLAEEAAAKQREKKKKKRDKQRQKKRVQQHAGGGVQDPDPFKEKEEQEEEEDSYEHTLSERVAVAATQLLCGWCGQVDIHASKQCGRCQDVLYCNKECQLQAWPEHKKHCQKQPVSPVVAPASAAR
jgi:tetratricopeptide (TPR) repeat protein